MNMEIEKTPRVVLVIRSIILRNDGKILIVRRSENDSHLPGVWEFPGGKLDEGQNLSVAQKLEVKQETGLDVEPTQHLIRTEDYIYSSYWIK
jgi:ADP-ribose pyrophosphatase YjhB (NUDIX family)